MKPLLVLPIHSKRRGKLDRSEGKMLIRVGSVSVPSPRHLSETKHHWAAPTRSLDAFRAENAVQRYLVLSVLYRCSFDSQPPSP